MNECSVQSVTGQEEERRSDEPMCSTASQSRQIEIWFLTETMDFLWYVSPNDIPTFAWANYRNGVQTTKYKCKVKWGNLFSPMTCDIQSGVVHIGGAAARCMKNHKSRLNFLFSDAKREGRRRRRLFVFNLNSNWTAAAPTPDPTRTLLSLSTPCSHSLATRTISKMFLQNQ